MPHEPAADLVALTHDQWIAEQPEAAILCERLRKVGGREIVTPFTIPVDTSLILACGGPIDNTSRLVPGMAESRCREHVAWLWRHHKITGVGTGWGLSNDVWHEHTWGMDRDGIVETTKLQDHYYGVIFGGKRAEGFL